MVKTYGYIRISTKKQEIDNFQNWILKKANDLKIGPVEFVQETVTGKKDWTKRELGKLFEKLEKGDNIITFEYSRLGRSWLNSIEFLAQCDRKGVKVYPGDLDIDPNNTKSCVEMFMQAVQSQTERENTSRRTIAALETRKAKGMKLGQKEGIMKLDKNGKGIFRNEQNEKDIHELIINGLKIKNIAEKYKTHPIIMGKYIKKWDLKKKPEQRNQELINKSIQRSDNARLEYLKNQTLKTKKD
jgi:DNA invertase Pin-like site-specific DNA recombinase